MTITATIKEINAKHITVAYCQDEQCASCGGGGGGCSHGFKQKDTTLKARNVRNLPLQVGDTVELFLSSRKAIGAGFLMFIVPLLLFILFYYTGQSFLNIASEPLKVLMGTGGLALGLALNLVLRLAGRGGDLPDIVKKSG